MSLCHKLRFFSFCYLCKLWCNIWSLDPDIIHNLKYLRSTTFCAFKKQIFIKISDVVNALLFKTVFRPVSIQVQLKQELKVHTNTGHSHDQSEYGSVCILRYLSHRYNLIRNSRCTQIPQLISIRIWLSLYS